MVCFLCQCATAWNNSDAWTKASSSWSLLLLWQPRPHYMIFSLLPTPLADPAWGPFHGHSASFWLQTMLAMLLPLWFKFKSIFPSRSSSQFCFNLLVFILVFVLIIFKWQKELQWAIFICIQPCRSTWIDTGIPPFTEKANAIRLNFEFYARICRFFLDSGLCSSRHALQPSCPNKETCIHSKMDTSKKHYFTEETGAKGTGPIFGSNPSRDYSVVGCTPLSLNMMQAQADIADLTLWKKT